MYEAGPSFFSSFFLYFLSNGGEGRCTFLGLVHMRASLEVEEGYGEERIEKGPRGSGSRVKDGSLSLPVGSRGI